MNTPAVDGLLRTSVPLFGQGRAASRCTQKVLVPFANKDFPVKTIPELLAHIRKPNRRRAG